jgi:hypothetical protein
MTVNGHDDQTGNAEKKMRFHAIHTKPRIEIKSSEDGGSLPLFHIGDDIGNVLRRESKLISG